MKDYKTICTAAVFLGLALSLFGCGKNAAEPSAIISDVEITEIEGLEIVVQEETVSPIGLTIEASINTDEIYDITPTFQLQKDDDGIWVDVEQINVHYPIDEWARTVIKGYPVPAWYEWENRYGELPPGKYRIVICFVCRDSREEMYVAAPFEIPE